MALDKQNVPISFGQGLDTKNDPKQLVPGKLTQLQNGVFSTGKEIKKRNGNAALTKTIQGGGTINQGCLVQSYNDELLELDGSSLYSYNSSAPNWVNKGSLVTTTLSTTSIVRTTTQQTIQDSAINGSLKCFTWYDSSGQIGYSIFDTATKQSIVNNQSLSLTGTVAKVLSLGSNFVVLYYDSGLLKYKTINTATPTVLSAAVTIASDINTNALFDATVFNARIYIAYSSSSARISLYYLDTSLVLSSRLDVGAQNANTGITIVGDASNQAWVAYGNTATVKSFIANTNLSGTVAAATNIFTSTTISNLTGIVSGSVATFYCEVVGTNTLAGDPNNFIKNNTLTLSGTSGTAGVAAVFNRDVGLASKVYSYSGVNYVWTTKQSTLQSTYFLFNGSGKIVAKLAPDLGGGYTTHAILPEVNLVSSGVYQTASLIKDLLIVVGGATSTQTGVQSAQITYATSSIPNIVLGQNSLIGGGVVNMYDGSTVVEHGYNVYPEGITLTSGTAAGSLFGNNGASSTNQYQYCSVYEWTDNQGQIHRSAPSIPGSIAVNPSVTTTLFSGSLSNSSSTISTVSSTSGLSVGMYVYIIYQSSLPPNFPTISGDLNGGTITSIGSTSVVMSGTAAGGTSGSGTYVLLASSQALWGVIPLFGTVSSTGLSGGSSFGTTPVVGNMLVGLGGNANAVPPNTFITAISGGTYSINNLVETCAPTWPLSTGVSTGSYKEWFAVLAGQSINAVVPTLRLTSKSNVSIVLYRTECNGTVFYRVTSPSSLTYNTTSADTVTIVDTVSDSTLIGNQQLYTTGGELENIEVPAASLLQTFKSRAIAIPSEAQLSWWYSKEVFPGLPVEFTDSFVNNVDSRIQRISAVGVLDEKIIFFGPTSKFFVVGDGPAPSGANNDYSQAQHITGSTGCTNQNSLLETPVGLIYQDPTKGIYLLDRSLSEQYIGQDVEQYNSDPVTSAQLIPGTTALRLTLTSGTVLLYDWFYNQWGADPYSAEAISSVLYNGAFTYVQANGLVLSETSGTYSDNGSFFSLAPTTGWLSFAGIQGFQRVYELLILGNYKSPHTLTVNIYTDYDDSTITQTVTIPVTSDPSPYEFRIRLTRQKCTAIKIAISDSNQSGTGESYSLSSMGFLVGLKQGLNKLPAAKSY